MKVFCPRCGDVTNGHPEMDRAAYELFMSGFELQYSNKS